MDIPQPRLKASKVLTSTQLPANSIQTLIGYGDYTVIIPSPLARTQQLRVFGNDGKECKFNYDDRLTANVNCQAYLHHVLGQHKNQIVVDQKGLSVNPYPTIDMSTEGRQLPQIIQEKLHAKLTQLQQKHRSSAQIGMELYQIYGEQVPDEVAQNCLKPWELNRLGDIDLEFTVMPALHNQHLIFHQYGLFITFDIMDTNHQVTAPYYWKRQDSLLQSRHFSQQRQAWLSNIISKLNVNESLWHIHADKVVTIADGSGLIIRQLDDLKTIWYHYDSTDLLKQYNYYVNPQHPEFVYFVRDGRNKMVCQLNLNDDEARPNYHNLQLSKQHTVIKNFQRLPQGQYSALINQQDQLVLLNGNYREIGGMDNIVYFHFTERGQLRVINKDNQLLYYDLNVADIEKAQQLVALKQVFQQIDKMDLFAANDSLPDDTVDETLIEPLSPQQKELLLLKKRQYEDHFIDQLKRVQNQMDVLELGKALEKLKQTMLDKQLDPKYIQLITEDIEKGIEFRYQDVAHKKATWLISTLNQQLPKLSLKTLALAEKQLLQLSNLYHKLDNTAQQQIDVIRQQYENAISQLYQRHSQQVNHEIAQLLTQVTEDLTNIQHWQAFHTWYDNVLPDFKKTLHEYANFCPIDNEQAYSTIEQGQSKLDEIVHQHRQQLNQHYQQQQQNQTKRIKNMAHFLAEDINHFLQHIRDKKYDDMGQAEQQIFASKSYKMLVTGIDSLRQQQPELANELEQTLRSGISQFIFDSRQLSQQTHNLDDSNSVLFGKTRFYKFKNHLPQTNVVNQPQLCFVVEEQSKGPGISPQQIMGDVAIRYADKTLRLWQDDQQEDYFRYGSAEYRGLPITASYNQTAFYQSLRKKLKAWNNPQSDLRQQLQQLRQQRKAAYQAYQIEKNDDQAQHYQQQVNAYAAFCAEHHIFLLNRLQTLLQETHQTITPSLIPQWNAHWVLTKQDEANLEQMARLFKMQLALSEGILNLKGHAGTGKDVLLKIFANRTQRPYFRFDCSKWTTEFELSEDIILEADQGASRTLKIPSTVLTGVQTPGAIVYFNEFNAMPQHAQIFLHALFDEHRSITLKTSAGREVKARKDILLAASMNPNYSGTFKPQEATTRRMVSLEIAYPPLQRQATVHDHNQQPVYAADEALKIARSVDSLKLLSIDPDIQRNQFIKAWDYYVNGIGQFELTAEQKFDIEVILALVQFANKLREHFLLRFEKSRDARKALPLEQPITLGEMRRCAYMLSSMDKSMKVANGNPEQVARALIESLFLSHLDVASDRQTIIQTMRTWTSQKRVRAA